MAFEKHNWKSGDVISSTKLNEMEDGIVEASEPVAWEDVTDKPTTFTPSTHSHTWEDITDKPETFTPTIGKTATTAKAGNYVPTWREITGKPETFAPETHTHSEYVTADEVADLVPDVDLSDYYTKAEAEDRFIYQVQVSDDGKIQYLRGNDWKSATNAPRVALDTHSHDWAEITGKPETFTPENHIHGMADVLGLQPKLDYIENYIGTLDELYDELEARILALETLVEEQTDPVEDNGSEEEPKGATE